MISYCEILKQACNIRRMVALLLYLLLVHTYLPVTGQCQTPTIGQFADFLLQKTTS